LKVFPNPNQGTFTVEFFLEKASPICVEIYDILGKIVYTKKIEQTKAGKNTIPIRVNFNTSEQLYSVRLSSHHFFEANKILIYK
jgi:hypothetical protein